MKRPPIGAKRRALEIKLCRSGFEGVRVSVDKHEQYLANAMAVASEVPNGPSVQPLFRMACNFDHARVLHLGDQPVIDCFGERLVVERPEPRRGRHDTWLWAKKYYYRQIYRSTMSENLDRISDLNRIRPSSNFKFHHKLVPTGRPTHLLVHGGCDH